MPACLPAKWKLVLLPSWTTVSWDALSRNTATWGSHVWALTAVSSTSCTLSLPPVPTASHTDAASWTSQSVNPQTTCESQELTKSWEIIKWLFYYKGHMEKTKGEWDQGREVGMAEVGGNGGGEMKITVFEQ